MEYVLTLLLILPTVALYGLIGFALWGVILSNSYERIGWRPLGVAYLLFPVALCVTTLVMSRGEEGGFFLMVVAGLPLTLITFVGVPVIALTVRGDRLGYGITAVLTVLHVLVAAAILDAEHFLEGLLILTPPVAVFFVSLVVLVGRRQQVPATPLARGEPSSRS